ncbi:MAG: hypothetical protein KKC53_03525 [Actinobacteria bacterium]|nr:hypothetical protein [Actinomycetota bacterium]
MEYRNKKKEAEEKKRTTYPSEEEKEGKECPNYHRLYKSWDRWTYIL